MIDILKHFGYTDYEIEQYLYFHNIYNSPRGCAFQEFLDSAVSFCSEL